MHDSAAVDRERLDPPPGLLDRLRQLVGYTWDDSINPIHTSYDIWLVFGTKQSSNNTSLSPSPRSQTTPSQDNLNSPEKIEQDEGTLSQNLEVVEKDEIEIVARISVHALREERAFNVCKTLASTVDTDGDHIVRPLDMLRLTSQHGDGGPISVCIFEYAGANYLEKIVDYGPAWYNLDTRHGSLRVLQNRDFAAEHISLQMFLDFAIGAAECIEMLHGQQIVHGELRGDAFHLNIETGKVKLINLGAGIRTFEHGLTSSGWSTMSKELGAKTKLSYMSPEQTGRMPIEPDSRTDIFSLGVLFWTMLSQKPAFEGETPMDIVQAVLGRRLPAVSNIRLDIPEVLGRIIQKATAKAVSERYHSISGLRYDLVEIRRLLGTGDSARLLNWEIATKDVSPSFILPEAMVGRTTEHDTIVKVIENAFKLRPIVQGLAAHSMVSSPHLPETYSVGFQGNLTADDTLPDDEKRSSPDGRANSFSISDAASEGAIARVTDSNNLQSDTGAHHRLIDGIGAQLQESEPISCEQIVSTSLESVSVADSVNSELSVPRSSSDSFEDSYPFRKNEMVVTRGRCEVVTVAGAAGLGKTRLLQSVQTEARQRGYFASSKFNQAEKTPFGPLLKLLSSLFQQAFSESKIDPVFYQMLKRHAAPSWMTLHKVLNLPEFLFDSKMPIRMASRAGKLSRGYNISLDAEVSRRSSTSSRSSQHNKTLGAQSSQDFLRAGSSMKSLPLINIFLEILRVFSRYQFICFCLDDLHLADEESLELIEKIISFRIRIVIIFTYNPEQISPRALRNVLEPSDNEERKFGDVNITRISLNTLNEDDVMNYVAITLSRPKSDIFPLGAVIQSKTAGNPFYIREMLDACHRKKCIWYDYRNAEWLFDLDRIFDDFKTENHNDTLGEDFVKSRLNELPAVSRPILAWASMLGTSFSFGMIQRLMSGSTTLDKQNNFAAHSISYLLPQTEQDSVKGLQAAIQAYILVPTPDDDVFRFTNDRYIQAAALLRDGDENLTHFIMAQTLLQNYSLDDKYHSILASSICESIDMIKSSVVHRQSLRKFLLDYAQTACESGARSTAVKLYASCIALLQDNMWDINAEDVYYDETLHVYTAAAECYLYRGQHLEARRLLHSVSENAKTAVDKAPSWILQSRLFAQEGDSTSAFQALKKCLVALNVVVDDDPTIAKLDAEFKRLCVEIQSIETDTLVKIPPIEDSNLSAVGAVLAECTSAAFWSDTLTFYQMTLIMVNKFISDGTFPQAGMGFLQLALIAITRHNMVSFGSDCGNIALALVEQWKDPYTMGRAGTIYSTFVGHIQHHLQASMGQLKEALAYATQAGDRISIILNFGLVGNLKFFASENMADLELFCKYGCQDIPNWQLDAPGGTMLITIRQVARALQGKTYTRNPLEVMSDEHHSSSRYKSWLINTVKNSDRPLMLYESIEIAPLFLYGHYGRAIALGNSGLKKINAIWSARNTRFLMFFHALSLAGSVWIKVQEQLDPVYRNESPQLSSDIDGRSLESGLQEEIEGLAMLMKYFKRRIEQWQVVTDVNYLAWSKLLGAQIAEMEQNITSALRLYEEALDHASEHDFVFEEALANKLLAGCLLRLGSTRLAKSALLQSITLYRQFGAAGVAFHMEEEHFHLLRQSKTTRSEVEIGVQTEPIEIREAMQAHTMDFERGSYQALEPSTGHTMDTIERWHDSAMTPHSAIGPAFHMLDWTSILESSQVISSVLQVDQLLKIMCEIILQNCKGIASLAAIVIEEDMPIGWAIAASGDPEKGAEAHSPSIPLGESTLIAENVVNYCTRFRETVFLPNLLKDPRFSNVHETWVSQNAAGKSVIALPISHGNNDKPLLGALYLEGRPNAFTDRNIEVLQLLVNQIGISYSNALTLKEVERVSAINKSMVDVQKKALSKAIAAEKKANLAKAEALTHAKLAEEAAKAKTTFLANISHELRTPLNGVIGNSELLLDSHLAEQQAEMADSIRVSADLLLNLINDILDLSKMEAHKMQLHITAFNANEMVQEMIRSIPSDTRTKKRTHGVRVMQDINLPQCLLYGDPVRLRQILGNLASNSLKFTEKGSITIGAKIEWETELAVHVTFWTKDTGIGIAPQQLQKLFKPFSQADASTARRYGGSGLGLSICKSLVESMGGTIKLESEENIGTVVSFSLTLPKAKAEISGDANYNKARIESGTSAQTRSIVGHNSLVGIPYGDLHVCVAEDNLINQKIALRFLANLKLKQVDAYDNGLAAVEGIQQRAREGRPYNIVLMDVQMPIMDGYEATKLLRKDPLEAVKGILIIALTASAVQGDRERCLASGMNDYLAKPIRFAMLEEKFNQYTQI